MTRRAADAVTAPPWAEPRVTAFLHGTLGAQRLGQSHISALTQGLSNDNALIVNDNGAWVLRINRDESSAFCQRAYEAQNWQIAAAAGLAPPLVAISEDGRCYLSERFESGGWHDKYAEVPASCFDPSFIAALLSFEPAGKVAKTTTADVGLLQTLLLRLSQLALPANHKGFAEQWQDYDRALADGLCRWRPSEAWRLACERLTAAIPRVQQALDRMAALGGDMQFSHRDLTPHNLLHHEGSLYCIDFEYACASHPLWDLAAVLASHHLSRSERLALAGGYLTVHPSLSMAAAPLIVDAVALHWYFGAIWALLMAGESADDNYLSWFNRYLQLATR